MTQYKCQISCTVYMDLDVYVEAENETDAVKKAMAKDFLDFDFSEFHSAEIVEVGDVMDVQEDDEFEDGE